MLAELIPQHRQKANKDLEEKNRLVFYLIVFVEEAMNENILQEPIF